MHLDHVVIHVRHLDEAIAHYRAQGFTVVPGGEHPDFGSHNALIALEDDSYLELIAFRSPPAEGRHSSPAATRLLSWAQRPTGLVDWALVPTSLSEVLTEARARGLDLDGPIPGSRQRPDGATVAWEFGIPDGFDIPFLCADVTPRTLRVPDGDARCHPNGALGIHSLVIAVADLDASVQRYAALLGIPPQENREAALPESRTASFHLGDALITLAAPLGVSSTLASHLADHGEGPYTLTLRTASGLMSLDTTH